VYRLSGRIFFRHHNSLLSRVPKQQRCFAKTSRGFFDPAVTILSTVSQLSFSDGPDALKEVDVESYVDPDATWQTGFLRQYVTLTKRNFLRQKSRYFSKLNFSQVLFMAVFAGLVWFRLDRTERTSKDRLGIVSTLTIAWQ
jgi:hypothetical protein